MVVPGGGIVGQGGGIVGPGKEFMLVTKGSFGSKLVVAGITTPTPNPIINLNLDIRREALLKANAKGHSKRYIDYIRQQMLFGLSYKQAHQRAAQYIGR